MNEIARVKILKLSFPIGFYKYNVQLWKSIDGGKTFWYAGYGKYCQSKNEARRTKREYLKSFQSV